MQVLLIGTQAQHRYIGCEYAISAKYVETPWLSESRLPKKK